MSTALETTPVLPTTKVAVDPHLAAVRALAHVMDNAIEIPGTRFRVGLDSLVGLVPVVGDLIGAAIGAYILSTAARMGVPKPVLMRMLMNLGIDAAVGAVPFAGDLFDAAWRANAMNARLLEAAIADPVAARRSSRWAVAGLVAAVFGLVALSVAAGVLLVKWVAGSL